MFEHFEIKNVSGFGFIQAYGDFYGSPSFVNLVICNMFLILKEHTFVLQ